MIDCRLPVCRILSGVGLSVCVLLPMEFSLVAEDDCRDGLKCRIEDWRDALLELVVFFSLILPCSYSWYEDGDWDVGEVLGLIGRPRDRKLVVVELDSLLNQLGLSGSLIFTCRLSV